LSRLLASSIVVLGAMLAALTLPVATAGQSALPSVRLIPIDGEGFELRLSPDRATAAVFDQAIMLNNEVDPSRLPIRLIDLASGQQFGSLDGFTDYAADVAFAPDGSSLASLHWNGDLYRWDLSGTEPEPGAPIHSGGMAGGRISYLPDSRTVLARIGYSPHRFYEYDLETGPSPTSSACGQRPGTGSDSSTSKGLHSTSRTPHLRSRRTARRSRPRRPTMRSRCGPFPTGNP
jgi:hypothetical protein